MPTAIQSIPLINQPFDIETGEPRDLNARLDWLAANRERQEISDREIELDNAKIQSALAQASMKQQVANYAAHRDNEPIRGADGVMYIKAPAPRTFLFDAWVDRLSYWARVPQTMQASQRDHEFFRPRVEHAIDLLSDALEALGKRDRAGTRQHLLATRSALQASLQAFDSVREDLSGPLAVALIARITQARAQRDAAVSALHWAGRDTVVQARAELDVIEADCRQLDRDIAVVFESLAPPALEDFDTIFKDARGATIDLQALPVRPSTVARAISEGLAGKGSNYWIIWESAKPGDLVTWRWNAFQESWQL